MKIDALIAWCGCRKCMREREDAALGRLQRGGPEEIRSRMADLARRLDLPPMEADWLADQFTLGRFDRRRFARVISRAYAVAEEGFARLGRVYLRAELPIQAARCGLAWPETVEHKVFQKGA